jgi:hypothetical protein
MGVSVRVFSRVVEYSYTYLVASVCVKAADKRNVFSRLLKKKPEDTRWRVPTDRIMIQMKTLYKYRNKLTEGLNNYVLTKVGKKGKRGEGTTGSSLTTAQITRSIWYISVGVGNCRPLLLMNAGHLSPLFFLVTVHQLPEAAPVLALVWPGRRR